MYPMNNKKYIAYLPSALDTRYVSFRNYLEKSIPTTIIPSKEFYAQNKSDSIYRRTSICYENM